MPQYSAGATRVSQAVPLTFGANLLKYTNPDIVQHSLGQISGATNTEIAKENVSDFLVSQAQHKIHEVDTQSGDLTKQDVQNIQHNLTSINADVASIKENLSLLAVAIADKSGKIDPALVKVDDAPTTSGEKEAIADEVSSREGQDEAVVSPTDNSDGESAASHFSDKYDDGKDSDAVAENSMSSLGERVNASEGMAQERQVDEKSEVLTSDASSTTETTRAESENSETEAATTSDASSKTEIADNSVEKVAGSELSLILQELKKVNDKVNTLDDKVDTLKKEAGKVCQSTDDEVKKKNN